MVIHAVYENGVFRPVAPLTLPDNAKVELTVTETIPRDASNPLPNTLAETPLKNLAEIVRELSENPDLPTDLAEQHDHYLYGSPKRS